MANGQHSPTPWRADPETENMSVVDADGKLVADCAVFDLRDNRRNTDAFNQNNAALIVRALNSHEPMKAAIQSMLTAIAAARSGDYAAKNWFAAAEQELLAAMARAKAGA